MCAHMHRRVCTVCPGAGWRTAEAGERTYGCLGLYPLTGVLRAAAGDSNVLLSTMCVYVYVQQCVSDGANSTFPSAARFAPLISTILISLPSCFYSDWCVVSVCKCLLGSSLCLSLFPPSNTHLSVLIGWFDYL